jgi:TolB-like protein/DNA-binding winged helix-turn-helix (wHTH) protein
VLDLASFRLIRGGRPVKLQKAPMQLLTLLVRRHGALVTREEIVNAVWGGGVHVEADAGINTAILKIRRALEDDPSCPRYLQTVVGKGYRFVGPITIAEPTSEERAAPAGPIVDRRPSRLVWAAGFGAAVVAVILVAAATIQRRSLARSEDVRGRVIIAVTPLQNLSEDAGQNYFVEGLRDEIITELGQLNPGRLVVVRTGSAENASRTLSTATGFGEPSRSQYVFTGSVRRSRDRARISVRLTRESDEATVWADSFDRRVGDMLALQSEIARRIGAQLEVHVLGRLARKPANPEVVEAYFRGRFEMSRHNLSEATHAYFERAAMLDPSYAPAQAGLADFYRSRAISDDEGAERAWPLAERYASEALSLDAENADAHVAAAQIRLMHDWDWHGARDHALRALQLNPSSPEAHAVYARYLRIAGDLDEAVNHRKQAAALDPLRADL